jgi:hypothetical protein
MFDGPLATESCACRHVTTVPLQPLYLLNNEFTVARAAAFARRVHEKVGGDVDRQISACFELALGRPPDRQEAELARQFFAKHDGKAEAEGPPAALVHFCQAVLNLNEFFYLE